MVKDLKAYEDIGLDPEEIKEILNAVNGGLAAENGIWCPKCGDALDIDIVNGVLAIGCFGCGGIVMCNYCQTPIYIKTIQYCKSLLAPLTPEQELRDKLLDMTGEVYVNIPKSNCPFCRR